MQIVINIPKGFYEHVKGHKDIFTYGLINGEKIGEIIANGTILPEHYGRLIDVDTLNEQVIPAIKKDGVIYVKLLALQDLIDEAPTILEGTVKT